MQMAPGYFAPENLKRIFAVLILLDMPLLKKYATFIKLSQKGESKPQ